MNKCKTVKDITTDTPVNNKKKYFLDTNVLFWCCYPRIGLVSPKDASRYTPYINYVSKIKKNLNPIYTSSLNISEMINLIERKEFELFQSLPGSMGYNKKDYRAEEAKRLFIQSNTQTALINATDLCQIIDCPVNYDKIDEFVKDLTSHRCDVFDYLFLNVCKEQEITDIVTDDGDFLTVPGITLYTSNQTSLNCS